MSWLDQIPLKKAAAGVLALALGFTAHTAEATTYFSDDFDGENGGSADLNYTGLDKWSVTAGSIDLLGNGTYDVLPGNGLYLDLIGSDGAGPGAIRTSKIALDPGNYKLTFDLAGSNLSRDGSNNKVTVAVGSFFSELVERDKFDPFTTESFSFTVAGATQARIVFAHSGPNDYMGALLDNVELKRVGSGGGSGGGTGHAAMPEPASLAMATMGLALLSFRMRRRRLA